MRDRTVMVIGFDGMELIDIASVIGGFSHANRLGADPHYQVVLATTIGQAVHSDTGVEVRAQARLDVVTDPFDTLVISGGLGHSDAADNSALVSQIRRLAPLARRVASVCTGATVLAAAGLLDGRRATTHWFYAEELARRFPRVTVDAAPIYIRDGKIATSGGVTSALDLTLAFVEEDHGAEVARRVAMGMVTYLHRPGNQAQMSMYTTLPRPEQVIVRRLVDHVVTHLAEDLSTRALAAEIGVSDRHLSRLCSEHLNRTPARFVRDARLEAAARMLTESGEPTARIARTCGFSSAEALRQAFVARYGISPSHFRAANSHP